MEVTAQPAQSEETPGALRHFVPTLGLCAFVALICSFPIAAFILSGYENVVRYDWVIVVGVTVVAHRALLSILQALHSAWLQYRHVPHAFEAAPGWLRPILDAGFCVFICLLVWFGAAQLRRKHCQEVCARAEPVLNALEDYRHQHGAYPEHLTQLPHWPNLLADTGLEIQEGSFRQKGPDVSHLKESPVTIYLTPASKYQCCVPIERVMTVSLARAGVYYRTSDNPRWREIGVFWDTDGCDLDGLK